MQASTSKCTCATVLNASRTPLRRSLACSRRLRATELHVRAQRPRLGFEEAAARSVETPYRKLMRQRHQTLLLYGLSGAIGFLGITWAAVPLYRMFCSATGYGGTPMINPSGTHEGQFAPERLKAATGPRARPITVRFFTDCSDALPWKFKASQTTVEVVPGETALAFFTARNTSDKDIIGVATYSVLPAQIAPYFAKVECFCFDEQRLLANEEVDLPVLFFIDRDFLEDPLMRDISEIILSYTFFRARRNDQGVLVPDGDPLMSNAIVGGISMPKATATAVAV